MLIQAAMAFTLFLTLSLLAGCDSKRTPHTLCVQGELLRRAIQSCDLPLSASVIAYLSVGLDRFLMTPDADRQSASITLNLSTGDIVSVEIVYIVDGDPHTIARAVAMVPAAGQLEFQEADFDLVDDNANSEPDCLELAPKGATSPKRVQDLSGGIRFSSVEPDSRVPRRPLNTGASILASVELHGDAKTDALCALDTGPGSLWYWWLPMVPQRLDSTGLLFVELDLKVLGPRSVMRSIDFFVVDSNGLHWGDSLSVHPGLDWTQIILPIDASLNERRIKYASRVPILSSMQSERLDTGIYILGDLITGTGDGSCIALVQPL